MPAVLQQSDYAIRCLLFLVEHRDGLATKTEIARAVDAPDLFVAKILQRLVKANVLVSVRGIHGGFSLAREPSAISLLDVVVASQQTLALRPCVAQPEVLLARGSLSVAASLDEDLRKHGAGAASVDFR